MAAMVAPRKTSSDISRAAVGVSTWGGPGEFIGDVRCSYGHFIHEANHESQSNCLEALPTAFDFQTGDELMKVPPRLSGTSYACREGMKTGALKADGSRNPFVPEGIGPLNRSQQSRCGTPDAVVSTWFF